MLRQVHADFEPIVLSDGSTEILRGILAQPILWAADYDVGFRDATAVRDRNVHDYLDDFRLEVPMYLNVENAARIATIEGKTGNPVPDNLMRVYDALSKTILLLTRKCACYRLGWMTSRNYSISHLSDERAKQSQVGWLRRSILDTHCHGVRRAMSRGAKN